MPIHPFLIYSAIIVWFSIGCVLSHYARKRMGFGVAEYFIGNRKITTLPSAMTYAATTYSAFMMVGLVGLTYTLGSSTLGFELTYLIGTVMLLLCFAPRIWIAGKKYGYITPTELLAKRFENVWVGVVGTIICAIMIIPYSSVQYMGIGYLVEELSGGNVPFIIGALIVMISVFIYAYWAGMRSVAWTDVLQGFIMLTTSIFLLFYIVYNFFGGWERYVNNVVTIIPDHLKVRWGFTSYISLTIPWFFFAISNPQVFQRCYIPKSVTTLKRMIWGFTIFGFIYTIICTQLGFMAKLIIPELKVADRAMPVLLTKVPDIIALVVLVGILAAAVSTLNSIILTLCSMCGRDILKALKPNISEGKELLIGKILIPIFSIICFFFAMLRPGLIAILSAMSSGGMLMLVPTIFATFFWKRATAIGALSSMIVGAILVGIGYIFGINPFGYSMTIWGLIIATILIIVISYLTKPPKIANEFINYVNEKIKEYNM
ncbi:MAG: sodium:solute symporter family protein [Nitrososphaerales archaeon]